MYIYTPETNNNHFQLTGYKYDQFSSELTRDVPGIVNYGLLDLDDSIVSKEKLQQYIPTRATIDEFFRSDLLKFFM